MSRVSAHMKTNRQLTRSHSPKPTPTPEAPVEPPVVPQPPSNTTLVHVPTTPVEEPSEVPTAGAGKAVVSMAGLLGVAAFFL